MVGDPSDLLLVRLDGPFSLCYGPKCDKSGVGFRRDHLAGKVIDSLSFTLVLSAIT